MKFKWEEVKINKLLLNTKNAIAMGPFGSRIKTDNFVEKGIPIIKGKNLTKGWLNDQEFDFLTEEKAEELKSSMVKKGDLVFTHRGTLGQVGYIHDKSKYEKYIVSQSQMKLTVDDSLVHPLFLYYFFKTNVGQHRLLVNKSQTGVPAIARPLTSLKNISVPLPRLSEQLKIVNIVKSIDLKININTEILSKLEELTQTLFKRWLVDFEFPNENGEAYKYSGGEMVESELGMIPGGWKVVSLSKIANFQNGLAMQKFRPNNTEEESLPVLKIKELRQGFTNEDSDRCSINIKDQVKVFNGDVIFSWSASLLVKLWVGGNAGLNQHLFKVTSEKYPKWFYYLWTKYYLDRFNSIAQDKATTMGHIKRSHLNESNVLVPSEVQFENFTSTFEPLINKKIKAAEENNNLKKLRDSLLPKLLSGEIELPDESEVTEDVPVS